MKKKLLIAGGAILLPLLGVVVVSNVDKMDNVERRQIIEQPLVVNSEFKNARPVTIEGYRGAAMEPFLSRDGEYLFFNNSNDPRTNTNLFYAKRVNNTTFAYAGEVGGVNTDKLEGVVSMDNSDTVYFVSTRSYEDSFNTLYKGVWSDGAVRDVSLVEGVSREKPWWLNMDAEISPDGSRLYFVDNKFGSNNIPEVSDIFVATKKGDGSFTKTPDSDEVFANVNNGDLNYAPAISTDGLELYFTRAKLSLGKVQIYVAKRTSPSGVFGVPELVGAAEGFVEGPTLSLDGKRMYYHKKLGGDSYGIFMVSR